MGQQFNPTPLLVSANGTREPERLDGRNKGTHRICVRTDHNFTVNVMTKTHDTSGASWVFNR